jgi:hypothetical protein
MIRGTILALLSIATVSCSNPLPFGPGRVEVALEDASVRMVAHETLFPESTNAKLRHVPRQVVQFRISSRTDLLKFFEDGHRQLQTRCAVDGSANGKAYNSVGYGPLAEGSEHGAASRGLTSKPETYYYAVYSFVDLEADDREYKDGKPATTLDLKVDRFDALNCHLLGVEKAPVLFPRSNDFGVSARQFDDLLRKGGVPANQKPIAKQRPFLDDRCPR